MIYREKYKEYISAYLSLIKEFIHKTSSKKNHNAETSKGFKSISWKSPKTIGLLSIAFVLLFGGIFFYSTTTLVYGITVNNQQVGYATSLDEAKQIVQDALSKQGESIGTIAQTSDTIEYQEKRIKKSDLPSLTMATPELLSNSITPYIDGYGIEIDGKVAVVLANEQEIDNLLNKYKENFAKPENNNQIESVEFTESISKVAMQVHPSQILSTDKALELLLQGEVAGIDYTIQPNDSWWLIARKHNMLTDEVLAANPGFDENTIIKPDQVIKIVKTEPYLTVISKGTRVVNEVIPFDVVTKTDSKLAPGKTVVKTAGKDGEKVVTYNYVEENGSVVEKQVVKEEVISQPVQQVVAKGPIPRSVTVGTSRGSGTIGGLAWPLSGRITSYYGYRWGGFHTGIDIDGDTGQPMVAAAEGTVVSSGWNGNYGYSILIDHGNGVATRYAHASKLNVKAGQTVSKGQTIALVGSTGRSTGSHLHFEVIINGSHVNPLNYL